MIKPLTEHGIAYYQRVLELERQCPRQQATIQRQAAMLKENRAGKRSVNAAIRRLQKQIQVLEERLHRNSSNSTQLPSSDGPEVARPKRGGKRKRRRGGQNGHSGRSRPLAPTEDMVEWLTMATH